MRIRILTGGHAIWMGGWTGQVHLHQDVIGPGGLQRSNEVMTVLLKMAMEVEPGVFLLPPAYALADSLLHGDHRIMPPDEIDPDYLDRDERGALRRALFELGCPEGEIERLAAPYDASLSPEAGPGLS